MSDLISRQAAIDALDALCDRECEYSEKQRNVMCGACHLGSAFDVIEGLPYAEPERKRGHWIPHPGGKFVGFPYMHYECDQCRDFEPEERNFCPNCGADMREREGE